jgi:hypothetical protein
MTDDLQINKKKCNCSLRLLSVRVKALEFVLVYNCSTIFTTNSLFLVSFYSDIDTFRRQLINPLAPEFSFKF